MALIANLGMDSWSRKRPLFSFCDAANAVRTRPLRDHKRMRGPLQGLAHILRWKYGLTHAILFCAYNAKLDEKTRFRYCCFRIEKKRPGRQLARQCQNRTSIAESKRGDVHADRKSEEPRRFQVLAGRLAGFCPILNSVDRPANASRTQLVGRWENTASNPCIKSRSTHRDQMRTCARLR